MYKNPKEQLDAKLVLGIVYLQKFINYTIRKFLKGLV